jgi:4a-hydroxytetrahydrobiopterin dehydratase
MAALRLEDAEIAERLATLPGWRVVDGALHKPFAFADFHRTMAFVNAVAWIAHGMDHHPDMQVGYNRCVLVWSTHSAGGITALDFAAAQAVEALGAGSPP